MTNIQILEINEEGDKAVIFDADHRYWLTHW